MALQQAVGLSVPSPRSCGLYSSIPNVIIGIPRFSIVFHWSFLLSASSFIGVSPSESLSFCTAKVYGCGGNERVPAFSLCHIHRRTTAKCHHEIRATFLVQLRCLFDRLNRRISFGLRKCIRRNPNICQRLFTCIHQSHLVQMGTGDDKGMCAAKFGCAFT